MHKEKNTPGNRFGKHRNAALVLLAALVILDIVVWSQIAVHIRDRSLLRMYFLDVGQGDSELVVLPGGATMLIDGGPPNGRVLSALAEALPPFDRSIDLIVLSHPQTDHFGGLIEVVRRFRIGAFISTGVTNTVPGYADLVRALDERGVPRIVLAAGDTIRYGDSRGDVLSPTPAFLSATDVNETTLVLRISGNDVASLFTGDADADVERELARTAGSIDVLKVSHHGSKFSSTKEFLDAIHPEIAVIEVGKNSYGHPTAQALGRLADVGARIFRTDQQGTIEIIADGGELWVFAK
jgi:competence protein ComEC